MGRSVSGEQVYRYTFVLEEFRLLVNQELNFRFDASLFATLSNGMAPAGFLAKVLQPDNPPGASGDFGLLPQIDYYLLTGAFSLDFTLNGFEAPTALPYFINQYRTEGGTLVFERTIGFGATEIIGFQNDPGPAPTPEPATLSTIAIALCAAWSVRFRRRRF